MDKHSYERRLLDLACLIRQLDQCPDPDVEEEEEIQTKKLSKEENAQQDLLDALAFIASTEKSAEQVAAVGMEENKNKGVLKFSVAMNGTVPQKVGDGLEGLCELVRGSESAVEVEKIFVHVLRMKRVALKTLMWGKKPMGIQHRLDTACLLDLKATDVEFDETLQISREEKDSIGRYTRETHGDHMKVAIQRLHNIRDSCRGAIEELRSPAEDFTMQAVVAFCMGVFELRHHQCLQHLLVKSGKIPHGAKLYRQLRKLSRYRQSVRDLVASADFLKGFQKVEVERVPTTVPLQLQPSNISISGVLSPLNVGTLKNAKSMEKGFQELRKKPLHVHAEVELVIFYTSRGREHSPFIGSSKLACFLCNMFLGFHTQFRVRGTHRKVYTGWTIPNIQNTPRETRNVVAEMCKELERVAMRLVIGSKARTGNFPAESVSGVSDTVLTTRQPTERGEEISISSLTERFRGFWNDTVKSPDSDTGNESDDSTQTAIPDLEEDNIPSPAGLRMCKGCREEEATLPCPHCNTTWYCTSSCMEASRLHHVFSCTVQVTSADHLMLDCIRDRFPTEDAARDFGFNNIVFPEDRINLLGLYQGLHYLKVQSKELHDWQSKDILAEKICEIYEAHRVKNPSGIGEYYPWFLKNKHLVSCQRGDQPPAALDNILQKTQNYLPLADRRIPLAQLPESKRDVSALHVVVKTGWNPGPGDGNGLWLNFGFWVCHGYGEEYELAQFYRQLFDRVNFIQFHQAYLDGSLDRLADSVGLDRLVRYWKGKGAVLGLKPGSPHPSAYDLKEFVMSDHITPSVNSLQFDYGYMNCQNPHERQIWREVYSKMFFSNEFDFKNLHEACIKGKLYEYVKSICPQTPSIFRRLAKNLYPLPDI